MKQYLWLPNTREIKPKSKKVFLAYKGGTLDIPYKNIHSIMFYESVCDLPQEFIEMCGKYTIPITIHKKNMPRGVWITPTWDASRKDLLTQQILFREKKKKQVYIARRLLIAKFQSMEWLTPSPLDELKRVSDIAKLREIEAWHAKKYWQAYYKNLGVSDLARRTKDPNPIADVLDAVSKFISNILLRWVLYHHFSPFHGFYHKTTEAPALLYDLMKPYQGYYEKIILRELRIYPAEELKKKRATNQYIKQCIEAIKDFLDTEVYVHSTRQIVTFHELYHGIVLALRSYLLGNPRVTVPMPSKPNGGRPINAGYKLYGRDAGITNFWPETKKIAERFI